MKGTLRLDALWSIPVRALLAAQLCNVAMHALICKCKYCPAMLLCWTHPDSLICKSVDDSRRWTLTQQTRFLRGMRADQAPDVVLCEELKLLYTAITRAKNNLIFFDSNRAKRAPFFYYLRVMGLAQHISR